MAQPHRLTFWLNEHKIILPFQLLFAGTARYSSILISNSFLNSTSTIALLWSSFFTVTLYYSFICNRCYMLEASTSSFHTSLTAAWKFSIGLYCKLGLYIRPPFFLAYLFTHRANYLSDVASLATSVLLMHLPAETVHLLHDWKFQVSGTFANHQDSLCLENTERDTHKYS